MKIIVDSEELKQDILEQSKYIHDFLEIVDGKWIGLDSDKAGILMHLYMNPDIIIVEQSVEFQYLEIKKTSSEQALVYLFSEMMDMHKSPAIANEFLSTVSISNLDIDALVHILNGLSPIKTKIKCWDKFVEDTFIKIDSLVTDQESKSLRKVIL